MTSADEFMIEVKLDDDPAAEPTPRKPGRAVVWIAGFVVLGVVILAAVIWRPSHEFREPGIVYGLSERPSFAWQRDLPEVGSTVTVIDDVIAVHPSSWWDRGLVVELLDPTDGEPLWRKDFSDFIRPQGAATILVNELPGTELMTITVSRTHDGSPRVLLVNRADGEVEGSHVLPDGAFLLTTTDQGRFTLLSHASGNDGMRTAMSLLDSADPSDVAWTMLLDHYLALGNLTLVEYGRHVGIDLSGSHRFDLVLSLEDGKPIARQGAAFLDGMVVAADGPDLVGYDAETGEERWREADCQCLPYMAAGQLLTRVWEDPVDDIMLLARDPSDGTPLWEKPFTYTAEQGVAHTDTGHVVIERQGDGMACFAPLDPETGVSGTGHCFEMDYFHAWSGESQLIVWDGEDQLVAVAPGDAELRWEMSIAAGRFEIVEVAGRLMIVDDSSVGVLE